MIGALGTLPPHLARAVEDHRVGRDFFLVFDLGDRGAFEKVRDHGAGFVERGVQLCRDCLRES